jgi:hypothetical protein
MRPLIYNTHKIFSGVDLGILLVLLTPFSSVALNQIVPQPSPQFYCFPDSTGRHFTSVLLPSGKSLNLIYWQWKGTDDRRSICDQVSRKFQDFYKTGRLNYIKSGRSKTNGIGIICGTAKASIECNERNKLFDVRPYTKPEDSIADDLKKRLRDDGGKPIYQGSDDEIVIDFQDLLAQLRTQKK